VILMELLRPGIEDCPCGSRWIAVTSEWEEYCGESDCQPVYCRGRSCWGCGRRWNEVLSENGVEEWIWDGDTCSGKP
jgi:hypothetical protein